MAKIHWEKRGNRKYYRLKVVIDGKTIRIPLGYDLDLKAQRKLEGIGSKLESLRAVGEMPEPKLQAQLNKELSESILAKFAEVGLIQQPAPRLKEFLAAFVATKKDVSDHTIAKMENSSRLFVEFFGDVRISNVNGGDAHDYVQNRKSLGKADSTIGAEVKHGRQFFNYAIKKRYLTENPFAGEKVGSQVDQKRKLILGAAMLADVIDAAPSMDWQSLLSVIRWTGCRQSEALLLKWSDVLWDQDRIKMPASKTEHLGKDHRMVPIFPELKPFLDEAFDHATDGAVYVVDGLVADKQRSGRQGKNLGKPFKTIIKAAGHDPWVKPFQNIRVTRENELERVWPSHVVQAWIGHSRKIAEKHYLTVSEDDFAAAVKPASGQMVVSNGLQPGAGNDQQGATAKNSRDLRDHAPSCDCSQEGIAPPAGERTTSENTQIVHRILSQWSGSGQQLSLEELARKISAAILDHNPN